MDAMWSEPGPWTEVSGARIVLAEVSAMTRALSRTHRVHSLAPYLYLNSPTLNDGNGGVVPVSRDANAHGGYEGEESAELGVEALLTKLAVLRMRMYQLKDGEALDALEVLGPFLDVVRSPETSALVTATALASLERILSYDIVHEKSKNILRALGEMTSATVHCKFEATNNASDELVLMRIMDLLCKVVTGSLGVLLTDESVCEVMELGLSLCCQTRLSSLLHSQAQKTMQDMTAAIFIRLRDLTPAGIERAVAEEPDIGAPESYGMPSIRELLRVLISLLNPSPREADLMRLAALQLLTVVFEVGGRSIAEHPVLQGMVADGLCKNIFQLLRSENTIVVGRALRVTMLVFGTMRSELKLQLELFIEMCLDRLILVSQQSRAAYSMADENGAPNLMGFQSVEALLDAQTWASDWLVQKEEGVVSLSAIPLSARDNDADGLRRASISSAAPSSRVSSSMAITPPAMFMKGNGLQPLTAAGTFESNELVLETLCQMCRGPDAVTYLYVNYDCNPECDDLFERLVRFVSRGVFAPSQNAFTQGSQYLCLDTLLEMVEQMTKRGGANSSSSTGNENDDASSSFGKHLQAKKHEKSLLKQAVATFNIKPVAGIKYAEAHGLIPSSEPQDIAAFLLNNPKLDKRMLGDYISRPEHTAILDAFMRKLDFTGRIPSEALRLLLEKFRLPGEAQQISRITEIFAQTYFDTHPPEIKSPDAAYVLAYSIIMLNTDLYNPQVRKRMDLDAYRRNVRGINDGTDFSPEFLEQIYESIREREIVLPEEQSNEIGIEHMWKELLRQQKTPAGQLSYAYSRDVDSEMFKAVHVCLTSALAYAFAYVPQHHEHLIQRIIGAIHSCVALASEFNAGNHVLDYFVAVFASLSGFEGNAIDLNDKTFAIVDVDQHQVTVSPQSALLGRDVKSQLALVVLFKIIHGNADQIQQGWKHLFEIIQLLFIHSLLPPRLLAMEPFWSGESAIPLKPRRQVPRDHVSRRSDGGLLSTLSSYLLAPYSSSYDGAMTGVKDEDVDATLTALDCVASCDIDEVYLGILSLPPYALVHVVSALGELLTASTLDRIARESSESIVPPPSSTEKETPNGVLETPDAVDRSPQKPPVSTPRIRGIPYDPSSVMYLELLTAILIHTQRDLSSLYPLVAPTLNSLLSHAASFSSLFNERIVACVMRLNRIAASIPNMVASSADTFEALAKLPPSVVLSVAEPLMRGLFSFVKEYPHTLNSQRMWLSTVGLILATRSQEDAARISFDLIAQIPKGLTGGPQGGFSITLATFASYLELCVYFANASPVTGLFPFSPTHSHTQSGTRVVPDVQHHELGAAAPLHVPPPDAHERARVRATEIVNILVDVQTTLVPQLVANLPPSSAWEQVWFPLVASYATLTISTYRSLSDAALTALQRTLLNEPFFAAVDRQLLFHKILFPLINELLRPQCLRKAPEVIADLRLRSSQLLGKVYLQYFMDIVNAEGIPAVTSLWLLILGYNDRLMHSARGRENLAEAIPESLKNILLVMHSQGVLLPPNVTRSQAQVDLWNATHERVELFIPQLLQSIFQ